MNKRIVKKKLKKTMGLKYLPEISFLYNGKYAEYSGFISGIYRGRKWVISTHYYPRAYISYCTKDEIDKYKCKINEVHCCDATYGCTVYYKEKNHGIVYDADYNDGDIRCMRWEYCNLYDYKLYYYGLTRILNRKNIKVWRLREILEHIRIAIDIIIDGNETDNNLG